MAKGHENLIPLNKRSKEVQREIQEKGRQANKEKWAEKKSMQERAKALMDMPADPTLARNLSRIGAPVESMADAFLAGLAKSALKGDVRAFEKIMEYAGQSVRDSSRKYEDRKAEAEAERAEMENELYRMRLDAIKGIGQDDAPDDGFLEALAGTAEEDWSDESI